jgi:hypothetical protein
MIRTLKRDPTRAGLTLIEILVSILILSVVSIAMIGILMVSSELFRRGEFSRSSNDEAIAVMGALDDDVKRIIPVVDGGWLYAGLSTTANGNCILGMAIPNPDPTGITSTGTNGRLVVVWFVDAQDELVRVQRALTTASLPGSPPGSLDENALLNAVDDVIANNRSPSFLATNTTPPVTPTQVQIITTGCLNFSPWLSLDDPNHVNFKRTHNATGIDWEDPACDFLDPNNGNPNGFATSPGIPTTTATGGVATTTLTGAIPMPAAMRITVVLTGGGRFAPKGIMTGPITGGGEVPISGVAVLPTTPGSMLRIDPDPSNGGVAGTSEWIEYSNYSGGKATVQRRGARRTSAVATHAKGDVVRIGVTYSLVRSLPR